MANFSYYKDKNKLLLDGKTVLSAITDIKDFRIQNNFVLILVDALKLKNDRNIYCYTLNGILKWQITEPDKLHAKNYYTTIYIEDDGSIKAYNINGVEITINITDGSIIKKELIK